jgi:ElaB/YqjD/DUF883 family membrane-anchored ribosome-binding protein
MNKQNSAAIETMANAAEQVERDVSAVVSEAAGLLESYSAQKLERAKATLARARDAVSKGAKDYAQVTDEYVHANPWKILGVAAAAGVLIGVLLARR